MPNSILITGGAGFIGSNAYRFLKRHYRSCHFHILDALTYAGDLKNIESSIPSSTPMTFWHGDVRNSALVEKVDAESEVIIHLAAETHVTRSITDDVSFFEASVLGTDALVNAILRHRDVVKRLIHISTSEVYGTSHTEFMDENHPLEPRSPYAASKAGADRLIFSHVMTHGLPAVIVRPFNQFGIRQHPEKLIPRFITNVLLGEPLTIHGTGESMRDYNYVDNLAEALHLIIEAPSEKVHGEVFNIGCGEPASVLEVANQIIKFILERDDVVLPKPPQIVHTEDRLGQVLRHAADASKIEDTLGWFPLIDLHDGLAQTIDWYVRNEAWWKPKLSMRYVNVPTSSGNAQQ